MLQLSSNDPASLSRICHALSTPLRIDIINLLSGRVLSCLELSRALGYPQSTISANIKILEDAGLVLCDRLPAKNGSKKMCSLVYGEALISLGTGVELPEPLMRVETVIPIGNYIDFSVKPSCGFVTNRAEPESFDDPSKFYGPDRIFAQLIWFRKGYLEYRAPLSGKPGYLVEAVSFELELCSEAPGFNNKWKSDITMWVNGVEVGTWTSPADFGDRRGYLTPAFWEMGNTQYGVLTKWSVTEEGTSLNGSRLSGVTIGMLALDGCEAVSMRIGVKDDATNVGGLNLFGDQFGDYPQHIKMCVDYRRVG